MEPDWIAAMPRHLVNGLAADRYWACKRRDSEIERLQKLCVEAAGQVATGTDLHARLQAAGRGEKGGE
jgi:hypothetical protein